MGRISENKKYKQRKALGEGLFILSLLFLLLGLMVLAWGVWPGATDSKQLTLPAGTLPGAPEGTDYGSQAEYTLTLDWPTWLRKGEAGVLQATLVETEGTALPARDAQIVLIEPVIPGLSLDPPGLVQTNLAAGQDLAESWSIGTTADGDFAGKVYLSFGFYDEEAEELVAVPVAVVDVELTISSLWGLDSQLSLWFGLVGLVLWGALFILGRTVQGVGK